MVSHRNTQQFECSVTVAASEQVYTKYTYMNSVDTSPTYQTFQLRRKRIYKWVTNKIWSVSQVNWETSMKQVIYGTASGAIQMEMNGERYIIKYIAWYRRKRMKKSEYETIVIKSAKLEEKGIASWKEIYSNIRGKVYRAKVQKILSDKLVVYFSQSVIVIPVTLEKFYKKPTCGVIPLQVLKIDQRTEDSQTKSVVHCGCSIKLETYLQIYSHVKKENVITCAINAHYVPDFNVSVYIFSIFSPRPAPADVVPPSQWGRVLQKVMM